MNNELQLTNYFSELDASDMLGLDGGIDASKIVAGVGYTIATIGAVAVAWYSPSPPAKYAGAMSAIGFAYSAAKSFYDGFTTK